MKKFWTTKDGVLGTAHESRTREVVDFRPLSKAVIESTADLRQLGEQADEEVTKAILAGLRMRILPAKGVDCASISLSPTSIDSESSVGDGVVVVRVNRITAVHLGVVVEATQGAYWSGFDVRFRSLAARQAELLSDAKQVEQLRRQHPDAAALTPRQAISFGKPVFAKLGHQNQRDWEKAAARVQQNLLAHFGIKDIRVLPAWAQDLAALRSRLLEQRG